MSAEATLRFKLSKKLKLNTATSDSRRTPRFQEDYDGRSNRSSNSPASSDPRKKRIYAGKEKLRDEAPQARFRPPGRGSSLPSRRGSTSSKNDSFVKGTSGGDRATRTMCVSGGKASSDKVTSRVGKPPVLHSTKLKTKVKRAEAPVFAAAGSRVKRHSVVDQRGGFPSSGKVKQAKRNGDDDADVNVDQPKRRKRVIRIDRNDTSNKRIDDGIVVHEITPKVKKEPEDDVEMSKNAQFRAIQPSPSILSFVEDNLLGRRRTIELRRAGYNTELSAPLDNIPSSTSSESSERERIEESIFRNKLTFFAAAKAASSFPPPEVPEIAFAGRSNVGKSSLLNSLTRQWGVARTSDKPGLTQTINFFELGPKLSLVDLPGYGFAYAKEEVKDSWEELVKEYVSTRIGLKRVCLLVDTKWGIKPRDYELIHLMERSQTKYQIVLTKTDLVFPIDVARRAMQIEENLKANKSIVQPVMMVSSKSGAGIRTLRTVLGKIARFAKV